MPFIDAATLMPYACRRFIRADAAIRGCCFAIFMFSPMLRYAAMFLPLPPDAVFHAALRRY